ncbi:CheY-like chemotaxis protein [Sphingomonas jinjuensis]|uniref:CheY-like chemotaxis protein n=1 Tax=Sphingomonas jinjuensis TaxID=535907 RepID=A0A840F803_9SPHN|nr:response regulator [Sphingomonas jinjuensis]MBB4155373.1 CheY-like chemotaxis protein [Sphingomonas jinjuensis]
MIDATEGARRMILVVEDNELLQMTTVDILCDAGLDVISVNNADQAMDALRTRDDIFAVFTDVDMPGSMDGIQLARIIEKQWPMIRTVLTSGGPPPPHGALPVQAVFYQKPYDSNEVLAALAR